MPNSKQSLETLVEELQTKIAFIEDALEKLSDEFFEQQKEILVLRDQQTLLISQIRSLSQNNQEQHSATSLQDEIPPHY